MEKRQIRNRITAQVSRTRKKVEMANYEDMMGAVRDQFSELAHVLDESITGTCREKCLRRMQELLAGRGELDGVSTAAESLPARD